MRPAFLIMKDNEYLVCMIVYEELASMRPKFSVHKYDAARIYEREQAKLIIGRLRREGEDWKIVRFNPMNGDVRKA